MLSPSPTSPQPVSVVVVGRAWVLERCGRPVAERLKSQVVSLQTAHSWANAGVLLGDACIGSGVAFEELNYWDEISERKVKVN